jgi:hypothetical protein
MHMRHIVFSGMSGSVIFSTLSHKQHDYCKNAVKQEVRVLIFSTNLSGIFLNVTKFE